MKNKKLATIVAVGLMAALCFVGNYLQIKIPNGVVITRIHFGNSMCLLAGLLFGPVAGGLASGIGAGLYDLFDPAYIISAPFTFLAKFAMGFVCGYIAKSKKRLGGEAVHITLSGIAGQVTYIVLYVVRTYINQRIVYGAVAQAALATSATNLLTSSVNAVIAVAVSVPLYLALQKPLRMTYFRVLIDERRERGGKWHVNALAALVFLALTALAMWVYIANKT